jgi:hypothetical protein
VTGENTLTRCGGEGFALHPPLGKYVTIRRDTGDQTIRYITPSQ